MAGHIADAGKADWGTPPEILQAVRSTFGGRIELDPCSNPNSLVQAVRSFSLPTVDGLSVPWDASNVFTNPPYGRTYLHRESLNCIGAKEFRDLRAKDKSIVKQYKAQTIKDWIRKCEETNWKYDNKLIALIHAAVDTDHWQEYIFKSAQGVCFFKGRVHFLEDGVAGGPAPMACAAVLWAEKKSYMDRYPNTIVEFEQAFAPLGRVIRLQHSIATLAEKKLYYTTKAITTNLERDIIYREVV